MNPGAFERRRLLLERMAQLEINGLHCAQCSGECCTSRRNCILITREEALDILEHLKARNEWDSHWKSRLRDCVREYRLDIETPQHGSRRNLRRTYSCPFYAGSHPGCQLPRSVKPYGCLAFNPIKPAAQGLESGCQSDQALLAEQAGQDRVERIKLPIPLALLNWSGCEPD